MAKKLSAQARIERLTGAGYSRKEIAKATGYSASQVGRIARGQAKGEKLNEALKEFEGKGKRARAAIIEGEKRLEHRREKAPSKIERAEGQLKVLEGGGVNKVIIHVTYQTPDGKKSFTLGSRGGIYIDTINNMGDFGSFVAGQAGAQAYDDDIDFEVASYEIEEYY